MPNCNHGWYGAKRQGVVCLMFPQEFTYPCHRCRVIPGMYASA